MPENTMDQTEPQAPVAAYIENPAAREKLVSLQWPVRFGETLVTEIRVRRITGKEVQDFFARLKDGGSLMPPTVDCPIEVWDALDADDQAEVDREAADFFPRALKVLLASSLPAGGATPPSSPAP
ncbi:hypothetical protein DEM27_15390 [Metarhizobium album]|uniref:Phage tail assembly protein n=1 Tax=Metarhizobium album TaxID=2182425 RepID=A0A2U2DQ53_9HYPH|nr:hypothetical protein [Rhizobium album]PWE55438.1 hypothetical protein DEM27_15390 [Rhizobium album]